MKLTRKEQATEARRKLIDAATKLISEKDYSQITISDLTKACGMSAGNFYHYFESKEDVFVALEREPFDSLLATMNNHPSEAATYQLAYYLKHYVRLTMNIYGANFNRQWFRYHIEDAITSPPRPNKMDMAKREVIAILNHGIAKGELIEETPVEDLAFQVACMIYGVSLYSVMDTNQFDLVEWIESTADSFVETLLHPYLKEQPV